LVNATGVSATRKYETLELVSEDGGILIVRLNRPDRLNAFTVTMANELVDLFTTVNRLTWEITNPAIPIRPLEALETVPKIV
jgi:1,4-dihydroxy-2-naphthoyl-CoA synthase